jgi:hypothetical protein
VAGAVVEFFTISKNANISQIGSGGEIFGQMERQKFEKLSSGDQKFGLVNDVIFKKFVKNQKNRKKTRPV